MLKNGSFSEGWTDMPPTADYLINQQPNGWRLSWVELGQPLYDAHDKTRGIPECVNKHKDQLPPNEQVGGPDALILVGEYTYKIFHSGASFGAELAQTVTGLEPGSFGKLTVPILADLHGDHDPYAAESGAWVNDKGNWVAGGTMGDRAWYRHLVSFTVPEDGRAEIVIRVKSKWMSPKDFFVDGIKLEAVPATTPPLEPEPQPVPVPPPHIPQGDPVKTLVVTASGELRVITGTSNDAGTAVVIAPRGVKVEVKYK